MTTRTIAITAKNVPKMHALVRHLSYDHYRNTSRLHFASCFCRRILRTNPYSNAYCAWNTRQTVYTHEDIPGDADVYAFVQYHRYTALRRPSMIAYTGLLARAPWLIMIIDTESAEDAVVSAEPSPYYRYSYRRIHLGRESIESTSEGYAVSVEISG